MMDIPRLLRAHPLTDERPWWVAFDTAIVGERLAELHAAFPPNVLHAAAIKACPLPAALEAVVGAGGGLEAASSNEVDLALEAGCAPDRIVFDSPAKTPAELRRALELDVRINADNLQEVERIATLYGNSSSRVGLRINPEIGPGDIDHTSVATRNSKFGVSLEGQGAAVREAFRRHDFLSGVHVHVGSQGMGLDLLVAGVAIAADLANEVGARWLDIGGGLPVGYRDDQVEHTAAAYVEALRAEVPGLFSDYDVVTEFGRWIFARAGIAVSRVEYVKPAADRDIATIHFGADFMLRTAYRPDVWTHRLTAHAPDGSPLSGEPHRYDVAGPLCFSGDLVGRDVTLPKLSPGDLVCAHDVGAYTFAMWSNYCSREYPLIISTP